MGKICFPFSILFCFSLNELENLFFVCRLNEEKIFFVGNDLKSIRKWILMELCGEFKSQRSINVVQKPFSVDLWLWKCLF